MNCIFEFLTTKSVFTDKWFLNLLLDFLSLFIKVLNRCFCHFSEKLFNTFQLSCPIIFSFQKSCHFVSAEC